MKRFWRSFYGEVAAVHIVLLLAAGLVLAFWGAQALVQYAEEADQRNNRALATSLAARLQTSLEAGVDSLRFQQEAQRVADVRPKVGVYLLSETGTVEVYYPAAPPREQRVSLEPVRRFLAGEALPILGEDPHETGRLKPFSAAAFEAGGRPVFLYVVLGSERRHSALSTLAASKTAQVALTGLVLILLGTTGFGLFFFTLLGRRLRTVTESVVAFEQGDLDCRVRRPYRGEVGRLANAFDRMADVIAGHVKELRHQARLRSESLVALVHDLRTPLASLGGYLERMASRSDNLDADEVRRYTEIGRRQVQTASRLVGELFELSKLEMRQVEPEPEAFPVAELVQDVAVQFQPRAETEDVRLDSAQPQRPVWAYADQVLVERALANLVENALRVTPRGGQVSLHVAREGGQAQVRVTDTGPGIAPEDVPHVFERFYRGQAHRQEGSTGLGLAIAKQLATLQGGALEVECTSTQGTTFLITLPTAPPGREET